MSFFFEDQVHVYDWGGFRKTGSQTRTKITLKLPSPPRLHQTTFEPVSSIRYKSAFTYCECSNQSVIRTV